MILSPTVANRSPTQYSDALPYDPSTAMCHSIPPRTGSTCTGYAIARSPVFYFKLFVPQTHLSTSGMLFSHNEPQSFAVPWLQHYIRPSRTLRDTCDVNNNYVRYRVPLYMMPLFAHLFIYCIVPCIFRNPCPKWKRDYQDGETMSQPLSA